MSANGGNISVSIHSIQQASEDIQKMRSVLRFLLGNLNAVTCSQFKQTNPTTLGLTDQYMLHLLSEFAENVMYLSNLIFSHNLSRPIT